MNSIFDNIEHITKGLSDAQFVRSKYDGIRMMTAADLEQKDYYKKRVYCNNRVAFMKLKYVAFLLIIPIVFLMLDLQYHILPDTMFWIPFAILGAGVLSLIIITQTKFAKLDYKILKAEINTKEDCDQVFM